MRLALVCGLLLGVLAPSADQPQIRVRQPQAGNLLVCRGGGDLHFNYTPYSSLSSRPQVWITFERASGGVGSDWGNIAVLQPGQCAWLERAITPDEPNQLALLNVDAFAIQWQRGQVTGISSELTHLNVLQQATRYQSFEAANNGNGFLVVRKIGEAR
jgi:hypothetical protein